MEFSHLEPTRSWWLTLLAISTMAFASSTHGQSVPLHDPYAARIQHCLKTRLEAPHEALVLADALLAAPQLPDGPRLGALLCKAESLMMIGQGSAARQASGPFSGALIGRPQARRRRHARHAVRRRSGKIAVRGLPYAAMHCPMTARALAPDFK